MDAPVKSRASSARPRARKSDTPELSVADKELAAMQVYISKITSSKKASVAFLKQAGIIDDKGKLAPQYRS